MKKIIVLLLINILTVVSIHASSFSIDLDCPKKSKIGEIINCNLLIKDSIDINEVNGEFNLENIEFISFKSIDSYDYIDFNSNYFKIKNINTFNNESIIGNISFKVINDNNKIDVNNIFGLDTNNNKITSDKVSKSIIVKSSINTLSSLSLSNVNIDFNPDKLNYEVEVDADKTIISAKCSDNNATISGIGTKKLNYGKNEFKIIVTSEDGNTKTYLLIINRIDNRNKNNNLKTLFIENNNINFNKDLVMYEIEVESDITNIKIDAEVEDEKAFFVKNFGPREVKLKYGLNEILIKVSAENEKIKVYTIKVNRKDNRSSDNTLSSLVLSPVNINFDNESTIYRIDVNKNTNNIEINAKPNDEKAKVEIMSPKRLSYGRNECKIVVTAENETKRTYTIIVNKTRKEEVNIKEEVHKLSSNANVKNISINNYNIDFKNDVKDYEIETDDKKLSIKVELDSDTSDYQIIGNENLKVGSNIKIVVNAEDGTENIYNIKILGDKLSILQITILCILWISIIICIVIIIKKRI